MRQEPTTAQGLGSIALPIMVGRTSGQAFGCMVERTIGGPSSGGPTIGQRLLVASPGRAFGWPDHALGPFIDRKSGVLAQEIAPGSEGASRNETPLTVARAAAAAFTRPWVLPLGSPWHKTPRLGAVLRRGGALAARAAGSETCRRSCPC